MAPAAAKHRDTLIATSLSLFQRQGYAATGLAEILAESGAPRGSLYHYFPEGKEAIAEAALNTAAEVTEQRIRAGAVQTPDPAAFARAYGRAVAKMMSESDYRRGCPVATVALEVSPQSERLTAASASAFCRWSIAIADMLCAAGFSPERAAELGEFMLGSFEGAMILARAQRSTDPITRTAQEIARLLEHENPKPRSVTCTE